MKIESFVEVFWLGLMKIGLPVVAGYHLITQNLFLNTSFADSKGIEWVASTVLIPVQYLLAGRVVTESEDNQQRFEIKQRFDYEGYFVLKTTLSVVTFPVSLVFGVGLKSVALCFPDCKERYQALKTFIRSTQIVSKNDYYQSLGVNICDICEADVLESMIYERDVSAVDHLKEEKEALKEIVALFNKHKIVYWVDCGTCLGAYRYRGVIPWDEDIDIAVLQPDFYNVLHALNELPKDKYLVQDWSNRSRPETYLRIYIRKTNWHIDVFHFQINPETKSVNSILSYETSWFLPESWKIRERPYTVATPYDYVFPLKKALFDGIEVFVPNQTEKYLQLRYGEDLRPVKIFNPITFMYEKDLDHPYWKRAFVH